MNARSTFPVFGWLLALIAMALIAASPLLALGYHVLVFKVAPVLQALNTSGLAH